MNILEETFAAHEHLAPDAVDVAREVRRRTGLRRHPAPRTLAVAGGGVLVAAVAAGSVVLGGTDAPHAVSPPARSTAAAATHTPTAVRPRPDEVRVEEPDHNTFGAGWLPGTATTSLASNSLKWGQELEYDTHVDGQAVTVLIQYDNATTLEDRGKTGPGDGTHGTYEGHPSVEWSSDGYWKFTYRRDATHTVIVEVIVGNFDGSGAAAIGEHVTRDLRFDLDTPIGLGAYLTSMPDGVHLSAVNGRSGSGIAWNVARDGVDEDQPLIDVVTPGQGPRVIRLGGASPSSAPTGTPGRAVQGHPSTVVEGDGWVTLTVPDLVSGHTVIFSSNPAVPTLDELYAIADGLRSS